MNMLKKIATTIMMLCIGMMLFPMSAKAASLTFSYAYDAQREGSKIPMTMNRFNYPFGVGETRKTVYNGPWTLHEIGTWNEIKNRYSDFGSDVDFADYIQNWYGSSGNVMIWELKDNGESVFYGVLVAKNNDNSKAVFIGFGEWNQYGYYLTNEALGEETTSININSANSFTDSITVASAQNPPENLEYTVTFDANGGSAVTNKTTMFKKLKKIPSSNKEGYTFVGWFTEAEGGNEVTTTTVFDANKTIYAHWTANSGGSTEYTITFNANGGQVSPGTGRTDAEGKLANLPTPTRDGYTFVGWYILSGTEGTEITEITEETRFTQNTTIYAVWMPTDYEWKQLSSMNDIQDDYLMKLEDDFTAYSLFLKYIKTVYGYPGKAGKNVLLGIINGSSQQYIYHAESAMTIILCGSFKTNGSIQNEIANGKWYILLPKSQDPGNTIPPTPPTTTTESAPAEAPAQQQEEAEAEVVAYIPAMKTTNVNGTQLEGWLAIEKAIPTLTQDKQQDVNGANKDLLHIDVSGFNKTIPASVIKVTDKATSIAGLHVFIGNSDAITFFAKNDLSGYKETNFDHKDTIAEHSRTIEFTHKQDLGTTVMFHTTVPAKSTRVTIYKVDADNNRTRIGRTSSNANGQVCFGINETGTYVLEY